MEGVSSGQGSGAGTRGSNFVPQMRSTGRLQSTLHHLVPACIGDNSNAWLKLKQVLEVPRLEQGLMSAQLYNFLMVEPNYGWMLWYTYLITQFINSVYKCYEFILVQWRHDNMVTNEERCCISKTIQVYKELGVAGSKIKSSSIAAVLFSHELISFSLLSSLAQDLALFFSFFNFQQNFVIFLVSSH